MWLVDAMLRRRRRIVCTHVQGFSAFVQALLLEDHVACAVLGTASVHIELALGSTTLSDVPFTAQLVIAGMCAWPLDVHAIFGFNNETHHPPDCRIVLLSADCTCHICHV